jgi:hypothetical protein
MTSLKHRIQQSLNGLQFHYDVFPGLRYQPLPWLGYDKADRGVGTLERWRAMEREIAVRPGASAMDLGCNVGFFVFSLAKMGFQTIGVEGDDIYWRIARHAARKMDLANVGLLNMYVTPQSVDLLPKTDVVIFLSVFHHWARYFGFDKATEMLARLWDHCGSQLFFDTGENEMPDYYNLPDMGPDAGQWIRDFLHKTCKGSDVKLLGKFKAFAPGGNERKNVAMRSLFCVQRADMA